MLFNTRAGRGNVAVRIRRALRAESIRTELTRLIPVASIDEAAEALAPLLPHEIPVAAGGDGTVGMVAAALLRNDTGLRPLGILPLGTANLLARNLGTGSLRRAILALTSGTVARIDVMRTTDPRFPVALVSIGAGFEGLFIHLYHRQRVLGRALAGAFAAVRAARHRAHIRVELDGRVIAANDAPMFSAGLYNTRIVAAGLRIAPSAALDDGWCEAIVHRTAFNYLSAMRRAISTGGAGVRASRKGASRSGEPSHHTWRRACIESDGPLQIDGQPLGGGALSVSVAPRALAVLLPPD